MNYLAELSAFDKWLEVNSLSSSAIALWFAIMQTANRVGWKNPLTVAISILERRSGLERRSVYRARNSLKQAGLIDFRDRGSNRCSEYTINSVLCIFDIQCDTQSVTQSVTHSVTQNVTHSVTQNVTQSVTIPKQNKTRQNKAPIAPESETLFDEFWKAYPRKVGKDAARTSFAKRKPSKALLDEMLAAISAQKSSDQWTRDGGKYIPNPSTWLNQGRWQDEVQAAARHGYDEHQLTDSQMNALLVDLDEDVQT